MKKNDFRKMVREEIKKVLFEDIPYGKENEKSNIISQIYQWIIRGDMEKAMKAMQNDPTLLKLAKNVDDLKHELLKRMSKDEKMLELISNSVKRLRQKRDAK